MAKARYYVKKSPSGFFYTIFDRKSNKYVAVGGSSTKKLLTREAGRRNRMERM